MPDERTHYLVLPKQGDTNGRHATVCGRRVALLVYRRQTWAYAEAGDPLPFAPGYQSPAENAWWRLPRSPRPPARPPSRRRGRA